jgi:hypothetical protein
MTADDVIASVNGHGVLAVQCPSPAGDAPFRPATRSPSAGTTRPVTLTPPSSSWRPGPADAATRPVIRQGCTARRYLRRNRGRPPADSPPLTLTRCWASVHPHPGRLQQLAHARHLAAHTTSSANSLPPMNALAPGRRHRHPGEGQTQRQPYVGAPGQHSQAMGAASSFAASLGKSRLSRTSRTFGPASRQCICRKLDLVEAG